MAENNKIPDKEIEGREFIEEKKEDGEREVVAVYYDAPPEETEVIGVRFHTSSKVYYFDPDKKKYPEGCHAIVETARGQEYGLVAQTNHIVSGKEIVLPLRKALRIAGKEDEKHHKENIAKAEEAFLIGNKKIEEHGLDMKLIDVEYTFDNSKLLFYFTSDGRVDFRELVKDLASVFHCRIELRQMGIRDEAKVLGGLGSCGRPFCCHEFLSDFVQVSIKMAKEQNLSLNAAKISGACGRLMCCLRYEYDTYLEEGKLTPKVDELVNTPDGIGVVVETKPLVGLVKVKSLDDTVIAPKVYHRDDLSPIKKGDDNYERAAEEKALEKQAKAAGTTRAALKAAAKGEEPKEKVRKDRPQPVVPQRAAFYTGQVLPTALESAVKQAEDASEKPEKPEKADMEEKAEKTLHDRRGGRNRNGGRKNRNRGTRPQNGAQENGERPTRYEKIPKAEGEAERVKKPAQTGEKTAPAAREEQPAGDAPKKKNHRFFKKNRGHKNGPSESGK